MDFHLRLRRRWLFLSLFFIGLVIVFSIESIWFNRLGITQAILQSAPEALRLTLSFFIVLKVLDWMTQRGLPDREDTNSE